MTQLRLFSTEAIPLRPFWEQLWAMFWLPLSEEFMHQDEVWELLG